MKPASRRRSIALAAGLLALVIVGACAKQPVPKAPGTRGAPSPSPTPSATDGPPPPSKPPAPLNSSIENDEVGFTLSPPSSGKRAMSAAGASSNDAVQAAWNEGVDTLVEPTGVHATYAVLSLPPNYVDTPVWLVTFEGTCVPLMGGAGAPPCRWLEWRVFVNADTGAVLFSFADSSMNV